MLNSVLLTASCIPESEKKTEITRAYRPCRSTTPMCLSPPLPTDKRTCSRFGKLQTLRLDLPFMRVRSCEMQKTFFQAHSNASWILDVRYNVRLFSPGNDDVRVVARLYTAHRAKWSWQVVAASQHRVRRAPGPDWIARSLPRRQCYDACFVPPS